MTALPFAAAFGGAVGIEHRGAVRVPRRRAETLGDHSRRRERDLVESRSRQLADLLGIDPADRLTGSIMPSATRSAAIRIAAGRRPLGGPTCNVRGGRIRP